ncbi:3451_t:CDS:2 [Paraglomus occultum]|uniref:3451_t:CDS:1 n=1 Tax=Paraglomus occultum TaxID=144539 RepID=A0A9N9BA05_9GLOM|nr:3451_t:CDS:2 [Paraglomus occultum]
MSKDLTRSTATTSMTTLPRKPVEILDEDTYTEAISEIIARDYFPTVASLKAQNEYLDALSSNDPEQLRLATIRLTEIATPQRKLAASTPRIRDTMTPRGEWDSPVPTPRTTASRVVETDVSSKSHVDTDMSLDKFQDKYTKLMRKQSEERREKLKWMFESKSNPQKLLESSGNEPKLIEGSGNSGGSQPPNALMFYPEGQPHKPEENSRCAPKQIAPANTRFESPDEVNINNHAAATAAAAMAAGLSLTSSPTASSMSGTPKVGGYAFVSATPSPAPSQLDSSELMTWGTIEGSPLLISGDQTPGRAFQLPPTPRREIIGMALSSSASRNIRKRTTPMKSPRNSTPTGISARIASPLRVSMLSPAAKQLLRKSHKKPKTNVDLQLRASYGTPSRKGICKQKLG